MKIHTKQNERENQKHSCLKWLVLGSMCMNSITNIILSTIISPIWYQVAVYYKTDAYTLNWVTGWYYFGPILFSFPLNSFIMNYYGLSQISSCIFSSLGLWILVAVKQDFFLGMLGFAFLGLGEALYCQTPLQLSKIWFEADERIVSTFISQYANNVGCLIGYITSSIYFFEIFDEDEFNRRYEFVVFLIAILATISIIFSFITLKQPLNQNDKIQIRDTLFGSLKKICKERETFFDLFSISSFIGLSWCYTLLFGNQLYMLGYKKNLKSYTTEQIEAISIIFSSGQIIAAIFCTQRLNVQSKKGLQQDYDKYIKYTISVGFQFLAIEILFSDVASFEIIAICNIFIGAGLGGIYSLLLESLMEKHYPVQELIVSTLLVVVACALSFAIGMITINPYFLQYGFQISCFLMIPPFCYILVFYETKYKRFESES